MISLEKRVLLASILSAISLAIYAQFLNRTNRPIAAQNKQDLQIATPARTSSRTAESEDTKLFSHEEVTTIESSTIKLTVGRDSASVHSVVLKKFFDINTKSTLEFGKEQLLEANQFPDHQHIWKLVEQSERSAKWQCDGHDGITHELTIELDANSPVFSINATVSNSLDERKKSAVRIYSAWERADSSKISNRYSMLETTIRTEKNLPWQRRYIKYREGAKTHVPRRTYSSALCERFFCQAVKLDDRNWTAELVESPRGTIATLLSAEIDIDPHSKAFYSANVYLGPRDFFDLRDAGFQEVFPVGFLSKIGLVLMVALKWIASVSHNYGIAIIALSVLVTTLLSPFTILGFKSMKRMQEIQPKVEQIKKKYEKDPTRMNKEIFSLFKENKVSPLGGCLPMLLQLPIFFALWSAISQVIELRGQSFLWIHDLTMPDRLAKLPIGADLNILPILMAISMYMQSKITTPRVAVEGQPNIFSGPMMSIIFGVMFYQVPSCLVLYWLANSLMSMTWYRIAKV